MTGGSLDEFLDCLDFAPSVIIDMIKVLAVELPLNDVSKREAIKDKLGFDVTKAIEIRNTKLDGETDVIDNQVSKTARRVKPVDSTPAATGRRYVPENK